MLKISSAEISAALGYLNPGLSRYCWIQRRVAVCDVTRDAEFQKRFNGFYRVRRGPAWRSSYYALMQSAKDEDVEFPEALDRLHRATGMVEASFASKLVATLDPSKPVIDSVVLSHFGLRLPHLHAIERQAKIVGIYRSLSAAHAELAASSVRCMIRDLFDERYPNTNLTPLKKLDLVLWQIGPRGR
jgi:hypothetical protein